MTPFVRLMLAIMSHGGPPVDDVTKERVLEHAACSVFFLLAGVP